MATVLGFCIAAPQLLAVLQYSQFSHRKNAPGGQGYEAYIAGAIQAYELPKMLIPSIQGNPRQLVSEQMPISTYYPAVLRPGANFAESAVGIGAFGAMLLCLLPLLAKRREPIWGIILVGAIGFLLAFGTPLNRLLYFAVPGWSSTGSPGRAICLFVLAAAVGAGLATSRLPALKEHISANSTQFAWSAGAFVAIVIISLALANNYELRTGLNQEVIDTLKAAAGASALTSGLAVSLMGLLALTLFVNEQTLRSKALLVAVPIFGCLAFFGASLIQTGKPDLHVTNGLGMKRIAAINASWDIFQAVRATLPPNLAALSRIHSLDGYDSLLHRDTVAMLRDIDGGDPAPPVNGNMMLIKPKSDWKKLADAGVTEVWSRDLIPGLGNSREEDGLVKYELSGPGRASTPQGPAEIISESMSNMKLRARGPGILTIRDRKMPGWLCKVDGKHVRLGGTTWMEVDLPDGDHEIELNYVPPGLMTGVFLAIPAWIIVILLAFRATMLGRALRVPS